jgi:peptidoglycan/xylan/chitin deacetylase (PgdA/CDA1 family)
MPQPIASLSLDLDNKWSYLKTHGDRGWESFPSYLDTVVPRIVQILRELDLRVTVFVVGQDAALECNRAALALLGEAGHEIGNHSFQHEPWLQRYSDRQLDEELFSAERAIERVFGQCPVGFRAPGYSISPSVLAALSRRGYQYDASSLPTFIGPLARGYYFFASRLTADERQQRGELFGSFAQGFAPLKPHWCEFALAAETRGPRRLLEIPVTTLPIVRTPFHFSYLLYLRQRSAAAAWIYWRLAVNACRLLNVAPSLLLHPLDFLTAEDEPALAFFPAMRMRRDEKLAFVRDVLADFQQRFQVGPLREQAASLSQVELPVRRFQVGSFPSPPAPSMTEVPNSPALVAEGTRQ